MRMFLSIMTMLVIYNGLILYLGWNGWLWLEAAFGFQQSIVYWILIFFSAYAYMFARLIKITTLKVIGSYWIGLVQYCVLLFPIANIVYFFTVWLGIDSVLATIWIGNIVVLTLTAIFTIGTYNAYSPVIRSYHIKVPKKANNRNHLRIAVASDMHFGTLSGNKHLNRLVEQVNQIKADIVLLPGDIIDDDPRPFIAKKMSEKLKTIDAPLGIYGVLGNHEYYGRAIPLFIDEMNKHGMKILKDEIVLVDDSFYLIGRKDKTDQKRKSIKQLVEKLDHNIPLILLDHQPYELKQAMENKIDISVSGHTHRGQMAPNHFITKKMYELDWGYKQKVQLHAFVSSGFGFWGPPLRLGSRSEILQIDVTFE